MHVPRNRWQSVDGSEEYVADKDAWKIKSGHVRMGYSPELMRELLESAGFEVVDLEAWIGPWGVQAHWFYERVENPAPLRALSIPVTDVCVWLDRRRGTDDGNTVYARAIKK